MIDKLVATLHHYLDELIVFLPRFAIALLIMLVTSYLAVRIARFLSARLHKRVHDQLTVDFIRRLIRYGLIIGGLAFSLNIMGFGGVAGSLVAGAGITAFVIGFAFKDIGENFLAGIILAFKRPFEIGDIIKSDDVKGTVVTLELRVTHIKTVEGVDVFIPNSDILDHALYNYTKDGHERYSFELLLRDKDDFAEARKIILHEIENTEGMDKEKKPSVTLESVKEDKKNLQVYYWINHKEYDGDVHYLQGVVMQNVKKALLDKGFITDNSGDKTAAQ
jgi:small-conductance mechanosensitive channel